jgi:hypothetical protein
VTQQDHAGDNDNGHDERDHGNELQPRIWPVRAHLASFGATRLAG